jgi:hypothetical protein
VYTADAQTKKTPNVAVPRRFSTLLTVFHVSPMLKWPKNAKMGRHSNVPVDRKTMAVEIDRKKAIVVQIKGNANGGGVHHGRRRSLNTGSFAVGDGRELSNGENTRERNAMKNVNTPTKYVEMVSNAGRYAATCVGNAATNSGRFSNPWSWNTCKNPKINDHCNVVAAT